MKMTDLKFSSIKLREAIKEMDKLICDIYKLDLTASNKRILTEKN